MKVIHQTTGAKNAVPAGTEKEFGNKAYFKNDTDWRVKLLRYMEKNSIEVNTYSYISIKLQQELEQFYKTGKKHFHIYRHKDVYGFLYISKGQTDFHIGTAYYHVKEIDTTRPWYIRHIGETKDWIEACDNIELDKDNKVLYL